MNSFLQVDHKATRSICQIFRTVTEMKTEHIRAGGHLAPPAASSTIKTNNHHRLEDELLEAFGIIKIGDKHGLSAVHSQLVDHCDSSAGYRKFQPHTPPGTPPLSNRVIARSETTLTIMSSTNISVTFEASSPSAADPSTIVFSSQDKGNDHTMSVPGSSSSNSKAQRKRKAKKKRLPRCSVCLQTYGYVVRQLNLAMLTTRCGHLVCRPCAILMMEGKRCDCPVCKRPNMVTCSALRDLFL